MYIPERIRIVAHGHKVEVFSLDEGQDPTVALRVAHVSIEWDDLRPVRVTVEYGSHLHKLGFDYLARPVSIDYPFNRVTMDVITGGNRTDRDVPE